MSVALQCKTHGPRVAASTHASGEARDVVHLLAMRDEELMAATAAGEKDAFDQLFSRYSGFIRNFIRRKVDDPSQAEDILQEVFLRLFRSASHFDPSRQLKRWLFTIAANEVRRYWSRKGITTLSLSSGASEDATMPFIECIADPAATPFEEAYKSIMSRELQRGIQQLPEFQRTPLVLRVYGDRSLDEISKITGASVPTVSSRLHYAQEKLRRFMTETQSLVAGDSQLRTLPSM